MRELLDVCLSPPNLVLTILLGLVVLYWLMVIFGALGLDTLDVDLDEPDLDVSGASEGLMAAGVVMLRFFNVGEVPLMLLLSIAILAMWVIGVLGYYVIGGWSILLQWAMLVPIVVAGMLIAKVVTAPLKIIFRKIEEQTAREQDVDLIGKRCRVISGTADTTRGQVQVDRDGAPLLLNVRTPSTDHTLKKGDEAVILSHDEAKHVYLIRGF